MNCNIDVDGSVKDLSHLKPQNDIIFVLDSVGWKEFSMSKTPNINSLGKPEPAWSHAYYTVPSIYAMFRGALPQPMDRSGWLLGKHIRTGENSNVPATLSEKRRCNTYLLSSNPVITNHKLKAFNDVVSYNPFFRYEFNNDFKKFSSPALVDWFLKWVKEPFFSFFLTIETHTPYMNKDKNRSSQIEAIELVDKSIGKLIKGIKQKKFKNPTRVIITSDHSEAWDGNKNHGHNPRFLYKYKKMNKMDRLTKVFIVEGLL